MLRLEVKSKVTVEPASSLLKIPALMSAIEKVSLSLFAACELPVGYIPEPSLAKGKAPALLKFVLYRKFLLSVSTTSTPNKIVCVAEPNSSSFTKLAEIIKFSLVVGSLYPSKATSSRVAL